MNILFTTSATIVMTLATQCSNANTSNATLQVTTGRQSVQTENNTIHDSIESKSLATARPCIHHSSTTKDSLQVMLLIADATTKYKTLNSKGTLTAEQVMQQTIIHIARKLLGVPYIAKTLERYSTERLIVNLHQLDCTTYVENVLAIYLCSKNGKLTFDDFLDNLRNVRYIDGNIDYGTRQHYFTTWIEQNHKKGFVDEIQTPTPPFCGLQHIDVDYMTKHTSLYPMLEGNKQMIQRIAAMEKEITGRNYKYITKDDIRNTTLLRSVIHDGDIIAIVTDKKGLDTSHIGIAVWHADGLHMLNASQIHKKVVEEPMTLRAYMMKHPSQVGIRIIRIRP